MSIVFVTLKSFHAGKGDKFYNPVQKHKAIYHKWTYDVAVKYPDWCAKCDLFPTKLHLAGYYPLHHTPFPI